MCVPKHYLVLWREYAPRKAFDEWRFEKRLLQALVPVALSFCAQGCDC